MHAKQSGSLGELKVAADLIARGYAVFTELGDLSRVDLIALVDSQPVKVQVKARTSKHGSVEISKRKSGPNYRFTYQEGEVDVFAIYVIDKDLCLYVNATDFLKGSTLSIRVEPARNGQQKKVNPWQQYTDFKRALRGHTQPTLSEKAEGEEMVQTTTPEGGQ
ncbi:MAG: group I intron-associated PD-(D/E)XK endonuclease [Rhodothermales bacterium]